MASRYQLHVAKWQNCARCELCQGRKTVVLLRGVIPAPVLFIGEAPGDSEDVLGTPFVGPAGHKMDAIIAAAGLERSQVALTNVIACIPKGVDNKKMLAPPAFAAEACRERLVEAIDLVKPNLIVWVGKEAAKYGPSALAIGTSWLGPEAKRSLPTVEIIHPAAIMRMHISQQGLATQRAIITIKDAVEEIGL